MHGNHLEKMSRRITIITVCFNSAKTIQDTLESVWRQSRVDANGQAFEIEYIVVDGESKDNTVALIREFAERVATGVGTKDFSFTWVSEKDNGLYDAMNKGIKMATGDIIGIVNSDDMLNSDNVLATVMSYFNGDIGVIYSDVRIVPAYARLNEIDHIPSIRYIWPRFWRTWMLSWGWTPPHPGLFIKKSAYENCGGYLTGYEISSDDEIIVRLVRRYGIRARYLPICASAMRTGGKSQSGGIKTFIKQNKEFAEMNRANGYFCYLPMMFPKLVIKALEIAVPWIMNAFGKRI